MPDLDRLHGHVSLASSSILPGWQAVELRGDCQVCHTLNVHHSTDPWEEPDICARGGKVL